MQKYQALIRAAVTNKSPRLPTGCAMARASCRFRTITACVVSLTVACAGSGSSRKAASGRRSTGSAVRYRLLLRDNAVDRAEAFRCYGRCQEAPTPKDYLTCLKSCPGFEVTHGAVCASYEVPPEAACLTVRALPASSEVPPGYIVLAVVGSIVMMVGSASLCASSRTQCSSYGMSRFPPPQ